MRVFSIFVIVALLLAVAPRPAAAEVGDVVLGGILVLRIRAHAGGLSLAERAAIVEQRITEALSRGPLAPETVVVRQVNGQSTIFVGNILIITVDVNHANLNGTTSVLLAERWARNLRSALPQALPVGGPHV